MQVHNQNTNIQNKNAQIKKYSQISLIVLESAIKSQLTHNKPLGWVFKAKRHSEVLCCCLPLQSSPEFSDYPSKYQPSLSDPAEFLKSDDTGLAWAI